MGNHAFSHRDSAQIEANGMTCEQVERQLEYFNAGFPFPQVEAPAQVGAGIHRFSPEQQEALLKRYQSWRGSVVKFVPASGAASRMFKELHRAKDLLDRDDQAALSGDAAVFFDRLREFAFYPLLKNTGCDLSDRRAILKALLGPAGLDYNAKPKGLLAFHAYPQGYRTAFEEHLVEAARYAEGGDGSVSLHFTVSPEHLSDFENLVRTVAPQYGQRFGVSYRIDFSQQNPATDTIAVDMDNRPLRREDGSLLFRPGGHGALLENLSDLHQDIIFIKNIDNVQLEEQLADTIRWKKILAGKLLEVRAYIHQSLKDLAICDSPLKIKEIADFLRQQFAIDLPQVREEEYAAKVRSLLDRPLRVCGVVKNTGEPGGGPFVVKEADGSTSLQILETAQLDLNDVRTAAHWAASTHFNPVDVVCSFKDYTGAPYALKLFSNPDSGFISEKSMDGKTIKMQELPGLWNGAMWGWNTLFAEVPAGTFNPVKTLNDLLRPAHCRILN